MKRFTERVRGSLHRAVVVVPALLLAACATPANVPLPSGSTVDAHSIAVQDIGSLPPAVTHVMSGDTLRIVRDAQEHPEEGTADLYPVRADGNFAYPYAGVVAAAGMTPEQVGAELSRRLSKVYRDPAVTVNIAAAPGNRIFVGGAVRGASAYDLNAAASLDQAIIGAGGILPIGDSHHVALLRRGDDGLYQVYFADFSKLLDPKSGYKPVALQRGDVVFVPRSLVGNAVEDVDLYMNQLLPFSKAIGVGFTYALNNPKNTVNVQNSP